MKLFKIIPLIYLLFCKSSLCADQSEIRLKKLARQYLAENENAVLLAAYQTNFIQAEKKYIIHSRVTQVIKGKALKVNDLVKYEIYVEEGPGVPQKNMVKYDKSCLDYIFFNSEDIEKSIIEAPDAIRYIPNILEKKTINKPDK